MGGGWGCLPASGAYTVVQTAAEPMSSLAAARTRVSRMAPRRRARCLCRCRPRWGRRRQRRSAWSTCCAMSRCGAVWPPNERRGLQRRGARGAHQGHQQQPAHSAPLTFCRGACARPFPRQDATISTLATDVASKLQALRGLNGKLAEVQDYLAAVVAGKLPMNHDINGYLQVRHAPRLWASSRWAASLHHPVPFSAAHAGPLRPCPRTAAQCCLPAPPHPARTCLTCCPTCARAT